MSEVSWIKVDVDMYKNEKLRLVRAWTGGVECYYIWAVLLMIAGKANARGRLMMSEKVPYSVKILSMETDLPQEQIEAILKMFEKLDMIRRKNGIISICDWENHQNAEKLELLRRQARERQRRYRERKKEETDEQFQGENGVFIGPEGGV